MNQSLKQDQYQRASELPFKTWLRLAILGSARVSGTGAKIKFNPKTSRMMGGLNGGMPFVFLGLFIPSIIPLSWINVALFIICWVVLNVAMMRSASVVCEDSTS